MQAAPAAPQTPQMPPGSLLDLESLSAQEIQSILDRAAAMERIHAEPLRGKRIALFFAENSTRTRVSFEFAANALGATTSVITAEASSVTKGESLLDTGYTLQALGCDVIVMRHPLSGAPHTLARHLNIAVINAGDGMHEHPTQGLLDAFTMLRHKPSLRGLRVAIIGDILHSRVARSNAQLLSKFEANTVLCGPPELLPDIGSELTPGIQIERDLATALRDADVVMVLRVQKERLTGSRLSEVDYVANYQLTPERFALARPDAVLMHPGPMNRGLEIEGSLPDSPPSVIREQVNNGVLVRMAVLERAIRTSK